MAVLYVNPFDEELHRLAKSAAALKQLSLREFVEDVLADALGVERPKGIDSETKNLAKSKPKTKK